MGLKEQFKQADNPDETWGQLFDNYEKIADNYAKDVLRIFINSKALQYKQSQGDYSLDELLLIIKKELCY